VAELERAMAVLGPLEGRIMQLVWNEKVAEEFVVRDIHALVPELAYTTVMTTLRRLADKGLLVAEARLGRKAYTYRVAGTPAEFLAQASRQEVGEVVARYGDAALAAFAAQLGELTDEQRRRLKELGS
jgi:predicted transcriptional regulator